MADKPSQYLDWNTSESNVVEPIAGLKSSGYVGDDLPLATNHNWIFNLVDKWIKYIDELISPNLILDANSDMATEINALADDSKVYLKESININSEQIFTKRIEFDQASDAYINIIGNLTNALTFQSRPHIKNIKIRNYANVTNAIKMEANFRIDSSEFINASGTTLVNTVNVATGYKGIARGLASVDAGSITNLSGVDTDGNSEIVIL